MEVNLLSQLALALILVASIAILAACGSGGASPSEKPVGEAITAEVCTEGEGRDTIVYFKNLDAFEWQDIEFTLEKGGETHTLGAEPQSMRLGRDKPTSWPPQSAQAAEAFTDSGEFTRRGEAARKDSSYQERLERLESFSHLTSATIEIGGREPSEWSGEVVPCE